MNFPEFTRVMLGSMDFFELRRTAARYGVAYQGVRRAKLLRDIERKICAKNADVGTTEEVVASMNMDAGTSSKKKGSKKKASMVINTYRSGGGVSRSYEDAKE